jgi:DNA-binding transcriptional MerR regulator
VGFVSTRRRFQPAAADEPVAAAGDRDETRTGESAGGQEDGQVSYRVDALAELTGISVRNIREYQDRGLLLPPRREGRIALYDDEHVVRLRLIERLLERGYTIAVIRDLLEAWSQGRNLEQVLGLESVVSEPWTADTAATVTIFELRRMFGWQLTPAIIRRAVRLDVLRPTGIRTWDVPSLELLTAGKDLVAAGIPLRTVLDVIERVAGELDRPAERLIEMVFDHVFPADVPGGLPPGPELQRLTDTVSRLRPHAVRAIDALVAKSLVRAVDQRFQVITERSRGIESQVHTREGGPASG